MAIIAITKMTNQLLLHPAGAKNPKTYSKPPTMANRLVREILNASFNCVDDTNQRRIPFNRITALFR